jgi:hypothetical protein
MDLGLILARLGESGAHSAWPVQGPANGSSNIRQYADIDAVAADVQLVFANCLLFNEGGSGICDLAQHLAYVALSFSVFGCRAQALRESAVLNRLPSTAVLTLSLSLSLSSSLTISSYRFATEFAQLQDSAAAIRSAVFGGSKKAKKGTLYPTLDLRRGVAADRMAKSGGPIALKRTVPTAAPLHAPGECVALAPKTLLLAAARHAIVWLKVRSLY